MERAPRRSPAVWLALVAAACLGCTGSIGASGPAAPPAWGGAPGAPGGGAGDATPRPDGRAGSGAGGRAGGPGALPAPTAGPLPVRRLTRTEYNATVNDLVGETGDWAGGFPVEGPGASGFDTPGLVHFVDAERIGDAARAVGAKVAARIGSFVLCDRAAHGDSACASRFVTSFGRRAFRRPLDEDEVQELVALYDHLRGASGADHAAALRSVLEAMLQAPQFLYLGIPSAAAPVRQRELILLTPHELAARLSYFLWGTMPDPALAAAADEGKLRTPDDVEREARRLLGDVRARAAIVSFFTQLLGIRSVLTAPKDPALFPELDEALRRSMLAETETFVAEVVQRGDGRLATLLEGRHSFFDEPLGRLYGLAAAGGGVARRELGGTPRLGLLTQASVLFVGANAHETYPHVRGRLVRERLLCEPIPAPPLGGIPPLPADKPGQTTRDRFIVHLTETSCSTCHRLMDPIGFGYEAFDPIGRHRAEEHGVPVVSTGTVYGLDGADLPFDGPAALAAALAGSPQVQGCVARQWFRFAMGRVETGADEAALAEAWLAFARSDFDLRELMVALTKTTSFLFRSPSSGEPQR